MNINTKSYWDNRFSSGDWESKKGRRQTKCFAKSQICHIPISRDFDGTLLDFGCGLGDAFPIYRSAFPKARLIGVDISDSAVESCRSQYGTIADFFQGDASSILYADIVIASNVLEHLYDDVGVARALLNKCKALFITVPYRERHPLHSEHINSYETDHFRELGQYRYCIFASPGWSQYGRKLWFDVYAKNVARLLLGRPVVRRATQIMFMFLDPPPETPSL